MGWSRDVRCRLGDLLKTSVPGKYQNDELVFGAFPPGKRLCMVKYLLEYLMKTKPLRGSENDVCLFFNGKLLTQLS